MKILKDKRFWLLAVITAIGFWLRLIFLNKPEGLWNDEYVSWSIASIPFGKDFFTGIISQCHMPLYYFYLKFFIHFWGSND
ncbi:hypothetical protein KBA27_05375, partial [bacterium]|nr:hypothetical protein [bacterium]